MCNKSLIAQAIMVASSAHDGYRRAGIAFTNGENTLAAGTVTENQLAQLQADRHLAVSVLEVKQASPGAQHDTSGALDDSKLPNDLKAFCDKGAISLAIAELDPENPDHFTSTNKPQVDALTQRVGRTVTAAERDEAWARFQSNADKALTEN